MTPHTPSPAPDDPGRPPMMLRPIGHLRTPFRTLADCPRNGRQLQPPPDCTAEIDPAYHAGLADLDGFTHLILLYWLGPQPGLLTITPKTDGQPHGVFATRTPVRPNPIALSVVSLHAIAAGRLTVRNLDCLDNTPLLDIKPYLRTTDSEPTASLGWLTPYRTPMPA